MGMKIEDRVHALLEDGQTVATIAEAELDHKIIYITRAKTLTDAIADIFRAMNDLECGATPSDFDDAWRALRLRLAHAQSKFEQILNGAGDIMHPPCHPATGRPTL